MEGLQFSPSAERNKGPILKVLQEVLPPDCSVLEIASGSGQHAAYFAPQLAPRHWLPSDPQPELRRSIMAWRSDQPCHELHPPLGLDVVEPTWPVEDERLVNTIGAVDIPEIRAIVNINMIHIAPWEACLRLVVGAGRILKPNGVLFLYGPFKRDGKHTAPSNTAFDQSLKARDSSWGIRDLEAVIRVAEQQGFQCSRIIPMPANNLSVVFTKAES